MSEEVELLLVFLLIVVFIRYVVNKIAALALLMYIQDHGEVPSEDVINKYTSKAAKKLFHIPS